MIYLDLFSGAGGGSLGIRQAMAKISTHSFCKGAFEIDPDAIKVYSRHFPFASIIGDISNYSQWESFGEVDLIIGGSPCTDLSIIKNAGQGKGDKREHLKGKDSILFYKYVEAIEKIKPKYFLLENVASMSSAAKDEISSILGVQPIRINSGLLSAQNRDRLYWANWDVTMPENQFIQLSDIKLRCPFRFGHSWSKSTRRHKDGSRSYDERLRQDGKANCLTGSINGSEAMTFFTRKKLDFAPRKVFNRKDLLPYTLQAGEWRPIFPTEAERLQTFPDGWTEGVSNSAAYRLMGKAMTVSVIEHIISCNKDLR